MRIEKFNEDLFSYKENISLKLSNNNFVLAVKDEDFPERHIIPIIYYDNGKIRGIDDYDMERIVVIPHKTISDKQLSRFNLHQLIKISFGDIKENDRYYEGGKHPKCSTINSYIYPLDTNQIIEFFTGKINEEQSLFTPEIEFFQLIKDVYVETENCFFIINENSLIGPFKALKVNDDSFKIGLSSFKPFGEYNLSDESFLEFEVNEIIRKIHVNDSHLFNLVFKKDYDFISDDDLLDKFNSELKNFPEYYNESNIDNVLAILKKATEIEKIETFIKKNQRLANIIEKSETILNGDIDLLKNIPEIKELKENKQKIEEELFSYGRDLEEIKLKKIELQDEILNLEETKTAELKKRKDDLDKDIEILEKRKYNLNDEIEKEKAEKENSLQKLNKEIDNQRVIEEYLKAGVKKLQDEFTSEQKDAQYKLAELVKGKTHFDFISGRDLSGQDNETETFQSFKTINSFKTSEYREFRNELVSILKTNNRKFEPHFIDNLLISIFQNTLTIFAGVPGTGKTTLARHLTKILSPKEKIREVSVNRGWTSQKDFIGFVNPLTKRFHSSSTDIYTLLKQMNYESDDENLYNNTPMSFIILDEANLSPLEHYWSSFYNLTDSTGELVVKLGHKETIKFPNNLRFIGTINYDHTTEELSPRVLDRINIIQLNKSEEVNFSISNSEIETIQLTFERCKDFFELTNKKIELASKNEKISKINNQYKEIENEFKKLKIFISPRVEIAIKKYIIIASDYMPDENKPLDYCVAQRLLPLINLQGSENIQKLEILKEKLDNNKCKISSKILEDIINIGSEKGIYEGNFNYFLTLSNV